MFVVGVMDVIEMVVDEQAELGVFSTGLIILVSGEAVTLALQVFCILWLMWRPTRR